MLRFDPFRELDEMRGRMRHPSTPAVMAFDAVRNDTEVTMYFDVPGVESDDLDVSVERNELTVTAERRWDDSDQQIVVTERPQGTFSRQVMLGDSLDTDELQAKLEHGVLVITIPVSEKSKQRRIDVKVGNDQKTIETSSSDSNDSDR